MMAGLQTEDQAESGQSRNLGTIRGAGDVREQRGHEAQQGMLVSPEIERMKKIPRDPPLRMALTVSLSTQYHYQQPIPLTFKLLQSSDKRTWCGVASRRTKVRTLTLTHSRCR